MRTQVKRQKEKGKSNSIVRGNFCLLTFYFCLGLLFMVAGVPAAEVDLLVTDYNENPSADQQPLAAAPIRYLRPREVTVKTADGKEVSYKTPAKLTVQEERRGDVRLAKLFASLGEYEPFSFTLRAKENLEEVFITAGELRGPGGAIPAANVAVTSVEGFHGGNHEILMPLGHPWNMAAHSAEFFWCTVHVPSDAKPGMYRGEVTVTARVGGDRQPISKQPEIGVSPRQPVGAIQVELEVLPIVLQDPPFSLGLNYSSPKNDKELAAHLADMRAHGMTCVGPLYEFHLPVHDADTSELGQFIEAYKKAGFPGTLYFAAPMDLQLSALAGYGSETTKRWQQKFVQVMKRLQAEIQKHRVPVVMSIGDELTNKGLEGIKVAGNVARFVWEELPEAAVASDMNGYREVMAMAPYLNVAAFNNGWDGIDRHNGGRQLINREFITEVRDKTGAIPWFVNGGSGRFPYGFFFWKMAKYGVRGKVEWYYNLRNEKGSLVRTQGEAVCPTLEYERSREGIDDLKYVCRLEQLIAESKKQGRGGAAQQEAEELLKKIGDSIVDNWTAYTSGAERFPSDGFDAVDPEKAAGMARCDALRRAVAERILALQAK